MIADEQGFLPEVDAFSSSAHARLTEYWSAHSDAFTKSWSNRILWIHPPFKHLAKIVEKIFRDQARGILLVPLRPKCSSFQALDFIAVSWWDLPKTSILFENPRGIGLLPWKSQQFRVVFFDAFQVSETFSDLMPDGPKGKWKRNSRPHFSISRILTDISERSEIQPLRSVIESAEPHPRAKVFEAQLRDKYVSVLEKPIFAREIDPEIRVPFGVAKIELKEGAKPMHKKFFRCSGEREEALNNMIQKLISWGWKKVSGPPRLLWSQSPQMLLAINSGVWCWTTVI
jgi:hypothetical protein